MATLHSKPIINMIHSRGKRRLRLFTFCGNYRKELKPQLLMFVFHLIVCRILKIDLSFPSEPNVSEEAKSLITQVHPS